MANVEPIPALRYDQAKAGPLERLLAPPYDVIDAAERQRLLALSPYNAVEIDLPQAPAGSGGDRYADAAETMAAWRHDGILINDEPALWALRQDYVAPDGSRHSRNAILARVEVEDYGAGRIRPHERTQPGPKRDRLELTRATRHNLSPIFSLTSRDAWPHLAEAVTGTEPWGQATDPDGTINRIWRITDPAIHAAVAEELAEAELLIADGHHRYETARTYAAEVGGSGAHRFTLMALTGLEDPGLTVFPTHRLLSGLADKPELQERLGRGLKELFEIEAVDEAGLDPAGQPGVGVFGYIDAHFGQPFRLRLREPERIAAAMPSRSQAYRSLDAAILETLVLGGILGMSEADVEAKRGIGYAKSLPDTLALLAGGGYDAAFILRATPIEQVRAIAAAGENMPPKSTYFYPKIPTGIVFNPLT
jgi:uncharacterized protein (DUF1015 family)